MSHFALVERGLVTQVIVATPLYILGLVDSENWIQTSYNTHGGVHTLGNTPRRKNFAGIGYSYDAARDMFIPPRPYLSWVLNENTGQWDCPVPRPAGARYEWNESLLSWEPFPIALGL